MSSGPEVSQNVALDDRAQLHKLGYAQELFRSMGGFQNFAISFTIISILAGCLTSYAIAFNQGGPVAITWGWLLVGFFCIIVSLAMGEIASTYPTAGGLYFWSSKLGSPAWGWFTGWFNLLGQIAVTAAIPTFHQAAQAAVGRQSDGRILVAAEQGGTHDFVVRRFDSNGSRLPSLRT